jgi:enamine deaminase RidA (YjgF/YER057c/UK114 family)
MRSGLDCRIMRKRLFTWLGRRFVEFSAEGHQGSSEADATNELFQRFDHELRSHGLSLDNAARVRVWGRDKSARTLATAARAKILAGDKRAASSSFFSQQWFDSGANAGLELLALQPVNAGRRTPVDFAPARNYLYYLDYDDVIFFSGFTSEASSLEEQVDDVLHVYDGALAHAGTEWKRIVKLSVLLQRGYDTKPVERALAQAHLQHIPRTEFTFVDGFAGDKYLIEIEGTAVK